MNSTSVDPMAPASAPCDPFDFRDFGGAPDGPNHAGVRAAPNARCGGFDPFAGQSSVSVSDGPEEVPEEIFAAGTGIVSAGSLGVSGPPLRLVGAAFAVAVAGLVLAVLSVGAASPASTALLASAGWLLAGPVAIGVLAAFHGVDTRRRLSSVYSSPMWLRSAHWVVIAACATGIGVGAWEMALWAGRL